MGVDKISRRCFSLVAGVTLLGQTAQAQPVWRLASGYGVDNFHTVNLNQFAGEVNTAASGALTLEIHPNNSLMKLSEIRAAVQEGKVQAGESIMSALAADIPMAGADSVPFVVRSYADAKRMWRFQRPLLEAHFAKRGLRLLYAVPWPPQGLFSTKPISQVSDFEGTHMRTYNATTKTIAKLLNAQSMDVPSSELTQALADGRVDNMITSAVTGVDNKVWTHVKYFYPINAWVPKNVVYANEKALGELAAPLRDAVLKASVAAETRGWTRSEAVAAASVEVLRQNGVKIELISPSVGAQLKRMGERFSIDWIRQVGAEANSLFIPYYGPGA